MRTSRSFALLILGLAAFTFSASSATAQFGGGGNSGGRKSWGGGGSSLSQDPNALFDFMAKGRPFFLVTDTRRLRDPLMQYAQEKGITNGQITRQQFVEFNEQMKTKAMSGGGGFPPPPSRGGPPPSSGAPSQQNLEALNQWADSDFKRQDTNGDSKLNSDEMPASLKLNLTQWDINKDGFIDQMEYRLYFLARLQGRDQEAASGSGQPSNPVTIIIEEEDWDRKPVVLRAGKLPTKGLPAWFLQLDADGDGQVALYEWRKAGKALDEFKTWDSDDDGFITPEEAMKQQAVIARTNPTTTPPGTMTSMGNPSMDGGMSMRGGPGGGRPPWGGNGGGSPSFGKKKRGPQPQQ